MWNEDFSKYVLALSFCIIGVWRDAGQRSLSDSVSSPQTLGFSSHDYVVCLQDSNKKHRDWCLTVCAELVLESGDIRCNTVSSIAVVLVHGIRKRHHRPFCVQYHDTKGRGWEDQSLFISTYFVCVTPVFQKTRRVASKSDRKAELCKALLDERWLANPGTVAAVHVDWSAAGIISQEISEYCFNPLILKTQCAPFPYILGWCSVYISDTDPVPILIFSYTPLGVITWWLPVSQSSINGFDSVHSWLVLYTVGLVLTPRLSEHIAADESSNGDVEISVWKSKEPQTLKLLYKTVSRTILTQLLR